MPAKNSGKFIFRTINSIIDQSYKNWELLIINDGSSDNTVEIVKKFQEKESRIKLYDNEEDPGIIPALRTAFRKSRGELITRMDSDDLMTKNKLHSMSSLLDEVGNGYVVTGAVKCFSDTGIEEGYIKYEKWLNTLILKERCYDEIFKECTIQSSSWMIHRDDLIKARKFDPEIYPEDYDLCFRFYKTGLKVRSVKQVIHYWRDHSGRVSRNDDRYKDQQFFDLKLKYFFELEYDRSKRLVVIGAGKKGKKLVKKILNSYQKSLIWISNNPRKTGKKIYGVKIEDQNILNSLKNMQIISAVSAIYDIKEIKELFIDMDLKKNKDFYFFC